MYSNDESKSSVKENIICVMYRNEEYIYIPSIDPTRTVNINNQEIYSR